MKYISNCENETKKLGREFAEELSGGEVVCLKGDLGAGKTTFVQGMMQKYNPKKRVLSPTFIIVRHYIINQKEAKNLFHVDLYRMENYRDIEGIGILELMNKKENIFLIEWSEKFGEKIPERRIEFTFQISGDNQRIIIKNIYE
jgi:tRNA threonylcarbamoyladenosine biosynthesis protein TsaE